MEEYVDVFYASVSDVLMEQIAIGQNVRQRYGVLLMSKRSTIYIVFTHVTSCHIDSLKLKEIFT